MEKKTEETVSEEWLKNLPVQVENPAFKPDEMTACGKCSRMNPPTRSNCLYCGAELVISEAQARFLKPNLRKLEAWEKGFNLIRSPDSKNSDKIKIAEIAAMLKLDAEMLEKILRSGKPLPLARVESEKEIEILRENLRNFSLETSVVSDKDLTMGKSAQRLRGMDFWDDRLVLIFFNADEIAEIIWEDLILIVSGAIFERKVEATEARGKKGETKLLDSNETASDEMLIDIYSRQDRIGFRVAQTGFDFSCLGAEKTLLASENIHRLVKKLSEHAPKAKIVEDYLQIRPFLSDVWSVEEKKASQGMKREGFGKFNLENITTINNSAQFEKYSRLQRHFYEKVQKPKSKV